MTVAFKAITAKDIMVVNSKIKVANTRVVVIVMFITVEVKQLFKD